MRPASGGGFGLAAKPLVCGLDSTLAVAPFKPAHDGRRRTPCDPRFAAAFSEAEWEYAARAKTMGPYSFKGEDSSLGEYAWYANNSENRTHREIASAAIKATEAAAPEATEAATAAPRRIARVP